MTDDFLTSIILLIFELFLQQASATQAPDNVNPEGPI